MINALLAGMAGNKTREGKYIKTVKNEEMRKEYKREDLGKGINYVENRALSD